MRPWPTRACASISNFTDEKKALGYSGPFFLCSQPPVVAISCNHRNFTNECMKKTGRVAVAILDQNMPLDTIGGFGFRSGREAEKFAGVDYITTPGGLPVPAGHVCGWLECRVVGSYEASTHTVFFAEVTDCARFGDGAVPAMTYAMYHDIKNGKIPPAAPHYDPEEDGGGQAPGGKWTCPLCGYQYDGEIPFEELPEDWTCPLCGQPKGVFVKQ